MHRWQNTLHCTTHPWTFDNSLGRSRFQYASGRDDGIVFRYLYIILFHLWSETALLRIIQLMRSTSWTTIKRTEHIHIGSQWNEATVMSYAPMHSSTYLWSVNGKHTRPKYSIIIVSAIYFIRHASSTTSDINFVLQFCLHVPCCMPARQRRMLFIQSIQCEGTP